jgi:AcrR family transcriptional regulator
MQHGVSTHQMRTKREPPQVKATNDSIVETAERLFRQTGFQKTTVADIAHELQMSPANVYRFFASKFKINEAVCRRLFDEIEAAVEEIAKSPGPASETLRNLVLTVSRMNAHRFTSDRKLHELFEAAHNENWPIVGEHFDWMDKVFGQIIGRGMAAGEFRAGDAKLASVVFRSICLKFCNPRQMAEDLQPTVDQIVDFCLAALADKGRAGAYARKLAVA